MALKANDSRTNIRDATGWLSTLHPMTTRFCGRKIYPAPALTSRYRMRARTGRSAPFARCKAGPMKHYGMFADPVQRAKFVERLARSHRGGPATPETQPEEQEKPFSSNEFWNDPEELQKAAKQARRRGVSKRKEVQKMAVTRNPMPGLHRGGGKSQPPARLAAGKPNLAGIGLSPRARRT